MLMNNKPRGLFGSASWTPGINPEPTPLPGLMQQPAPKQVEQPKPRGTGRRIAGYLADFLAGMNGQSGPYASILQQEREAEERQRMFEQQRRAGFDDFVQRKTWERDNMPSQSSPHYWETNDGSLGMVGPDGKPQILYKDPTPKTDWIQVKDPVTGAISIVAKPIGGALPTFTAEDWDKAGGGTGNGVGGFR